MNSLPPLPLIDGCLFVDNSMLELLTTCPRALEYNRLHQRVAAISKPSLAFGSAIHLALEHRYKNYGVHAPDVSLEMEQSEILSRFFEANPAPADDFRNLNWAFEMVKRYNQTYDLEPFQLLTDVKGDKMVELSFALPLFTYKVSESNEPLLQKLLDIPVIYTGRIDLPVIWDNQLFIGDHKTTSMIGPSFFDKMKMSAQQKGYCYSGDTEVLTPHGWVRFDSLPQNLPVAQWDNGIIQFVKPTQYFEKQVNENLIQYTGSVETLTTSEHRFIVKDRQSKQYKNFTANTLPLSSNYKIPCAGTWVPEKTIWSDAFMQLTAMTQADGHFTQSDGLRFHFFKDRKIERCRANLIRWGLVFTESIQTDGTTCFYCSNTNRLVQEVQEMLGPQKLFGPWLLYCTSTQLEVFLEEVKHWDGSDRGPKGFIYSSEHEQNAKWIQTVACLVRRRASIHTQENNEKLQWRVNVALEKETIGIGGLNKTLIPHKGLVYCLNVPSTWLLTKRNNVITVAGNSWAFGELTGQKPVGYFINAIRTKEPPLSLGKENGRTKQTVAQWWRETFQRERYFLQPGELDEWKANAIALVEELFYHYQNDYMPMKTAWCNQYGRCPYFDVCSLPAADRLIALNSNWYTLNVWNPLRSPTQSKQ